MDSEPKNSVNDQVQ